MRVDSRNGFALLPENLHRAQDRQAPKTLPGETGLTAGPDAAIIAHVCFAAVKRSGCPSATAAFLGMENGHGPNPTFDHGW
jgi:hypothetical protein